jgi:ABC-2 type transport system permease protein
MNAVKEWALLRSSVREYLRFKALAGAVALILIPPLLAFVWKLNASSIRYKPDVTYNFIAAFFVFGFILTLLSLIYTSGIVSREVEQKSIVYLLTRPIPRWRIALTRLAGGWAATCVTTWLSLLLLTVVVYGFDGLRSDAVLRDLLCIPVGAASYGCLFLMLGTLFERPLTYGLVFAFGWESWVPSFTGAYKKLSIMTYLRVLAPHETPTPPTIRPEAMDVLAVLNPTTITRSEAWVVLLVVIAVSLGVALLVFSKREYVPKENSV